MSEKTFDKFGKELTETKKITRVRIIELLD